MSVTQFLSKYTKIAKPFAPADLSELKSNPAIERRLKVYFDILDFAILYHAGNWSHFLAFGSPVSKGESRSGFFSNSVLLLESSRHSPGLMALTTRLGKSAASEIILCMGASRVGAYCSVLSD